MKRVALLVFAMLMVAGLAVVAQVEEQPKIMIERKLVFIETGGDLNFPEEAAAPDATGWFVSNTWYLYLACNYGYRFLWHATPFRLLDSSGKKTDVCMRTQALFGGTLHNGWLSGSWIEITCPEWNSTPSPPFYGEFTGWIRMRVYRNGYNDKAGTWVSDPEAIVYEE